MQYNRRKVCSPSLDLSQKAESDEKSVILVLA